MQMSQKKPNNKPVDSPDPAFIQRNVETLSAIGGVYDYIAQWVEYDHRDILEPHRIATQSKSTVELFEQRQKAITETNERKTNAKTRKTRNDNRG